MDPFLLGMLGAGVLGAAGGIGATAYSADAARKGQQLAQAFNATESAGASARGYDYLIRQMNATYAKPSDNPLTPLRNVTQAEIDAKRAKYQRLDTNKNSEYWEATNLSGQNRYVNSVDDAMNWWLYGKTAADIDLLQNGGAQYRANNAQLDYLKQAPSAIKQGYINAGYNPLSAIDGNAAAQPALSMGGTINSSAGSSDSGRSVQVADVVGSIVSAVSALNQTKLTNKQAENIEADTKLKQAETKDIAEERAQKKADYQLELEKLGLEQKRLQVQEGKIDVEKRQIENIIDLNNKRFSIEQRQEIAGYIDKALKHGETIAGLLSGLEHLKVAGDKLKNLVHYFKSSPITK